MVAYALRDVRSHSFCSLASSVVGVRSVAGMFAADGGSYQGPSLLDSPLVTYKEPTEHIGEGVKFAFYRNLANGIKTGQVIVLENEEPPNDLKETISFSEFCFYGFI